MELIKKDNTIAKEIRNEFPILSRTVNNKKLVYFDNGATTQKPQSVINALIQYYSVYNSNIHRGVHSLSQEATNAYDKSRDFIAKYLNAPKAEEVIFTRGTTESINLIAHCFGEKFIHENDEIIISEMEHHSNILPWQELCKRKKAKLNIISVLENGTLNYEHFATLLNNKTKLVAITHVSNTLGTVNDIEKIIQVAHEKNIPVLIDGAQAVPHLAIDLKKLDVDFYVFSGHKVYAPTGIGIVYAKEKWWKQFDVYQTGGGTINTVTFKETIYAEMPHKFEAGTPNIEGAIGLAEALKFVQKIGISSIVNHEHELLVYATNRLKNINGIKIIGEAPCKAGVISFVVDNVHPFDIGTLLDKHGIAVRTGHHCTQPLMQRFNIQGTVRLSFAVYNTFEEIDIFINALEKTLTMLR